MLKRTLYNFQIGKHVLTCIYSCNFFIDLFLWQYILTSLLSFLTRVLLKPPTHRPLTRRSTTDYHKLTLKKRPDSKHVLYSKVLENFCNYLFPE